MASIRIHFWDVCLFVDSGAAGVDIRGAILSIVQNTAAPGASAPDLTALAGRVPDLDKLLGQTTLDSDKLAPTLHRDLVGRIDLPGGSFAPQTPRRVPS